MFGLIHKGWWRRAARPAPATSFVPERLAWSPVESARMKAVLKSGFGQRLLNQLEQLEYRTMVNSTYALNNLTTEQNAFIARGIREAALFLQKLSYASDAQEAKPSDIGAQGEAPTDETAEAYEQRHSP